MLNRCLLTVTAKKPFHDWLHTFPEARDMTLEELNQDGVGYLLPELDDDDDLETLLPQCFDLLFEEELGAWQEDESRWPPTRDLETFKEWFDVQLRSIVVDLTGEPLEDDEA